MGDVRAILGRGPGAVLSFWASLLASCSDVPDQRPLCGLVSGAPLSTQEAVDLAYCSDRIDCVLGGVCHWDGGSCVGTRETCTRSMKCMDGVCEMSDDGTSCVPGDPPRCSSCLGDHCGAHFLTSQFGCKVESCAYLCATHGLCAEAAEGCKAKDNASCAQSARCRLHGECQVAARSDGVTCVRRAWQDAWGSQLCRHYGVQCLTWGDHEAVGATLDAVKAGLIEPFVPTAEAPVAGCTQSPSIGSCPSWELCAWAGACGWDGERCVPRDSWDCLHSTNCLEKDWCWRVGDRCGVRTDGDCVRCVDGDSNLVLPSTASVLQISATCASTGQASGGRCQPTEPQHCWLDCLTEGECSIMEGRCVAQSDADCQKSKACIERGNCTVHKSSGVCYSPTSAACTQTAPPRAWCPKSLRDGLPRCSLDADQCLAELVEPSNP